MAGWIKVDLKVVREDSWEIAGEAMQHETKLLKRLGTSWNAADSNSRQLDLLQSSLDMKLLTVT
jgi:hypothetical protein